MADLIKDDTTDQMIVCPLVDTNYALVTTTLTSPTITMIINNGSDVDLSSAATLTYSATIGGHKLVIPHGSITATGRYEICIQHASILNYNLDGLIVLPQSNFATSAEIDAIKGADWTAETGNLVMIQAAALDTLTNGATKSDVADILGIGWTNQSIVSLESDIAGISITGGSGGMGHIIASYTFDPAANTITITEVGYTDIIQEQILSVFNSTTGQWYYNSELRRYGAEPGKPWTKYFPLDSVTDGVITYTAPDTNATAEDVLQIIVNKA